MAVVLFFVAILLTCLQNNSPFIQWFFESSLIYSREVDLHIIGEEETSKHMRI